GMQEKGNGVAAGMPHFPGRVHYAVRSGSQAVVGQALQHVAYVHHYLLREGGDRHPVILLVQYLQSVCRSAYQQGNEVNVLMLLCTDGGFRLLCDRRVVDSAQDGIAVMDLVVK